MREGVEQLKRWTGKARATIVFDTTVDLFTHDGLFNKVKGKQDVAVIGFTTDGDVFGGFYSVAATKQCQWFFWDPNIFVFSFESHGRCMTPQRFVPKEELKRRARVKFWKSNKSGFVWFGVDLCGGFYLGHERSKSCCLNKSRAIEGLEDTTPTESHNRNLKKPPSTTAPALSQFSLSD